MGGRGEEVWEGEMGRCGQRERIRHVMWVSRYNLRQKEQVVVVHSWQVRYDDGGGGEVEEREAWSKAERL